MKTIFRNLAFGAALTGIGIVSGTTALAQDVCTEVEAKQALYAQFTSNFDKKEIDRRKVAIDAGKQYVQKYGACADDKAIVDYLNANIPAMEKAVQDTQRKAAQDALFTRFDTAVKGTGGKANPADTLTSGKDIVAQNPDFLDVILVLGSVGFDQATLPTPIDTYNNDTIQYAKMAIQKLESNTPSKTGNYGVLQYSYKTKDFPDGRSNALGAMNYNIGYLMYYRQGKDNPEKRKEALPYFYKSIQYNSFSKKEPLVYQAIGAWYLDEAIKIDKERQVKLAANGNKDNDETLAMVANQKGYADRAIDAYARAYKLAKEDKNQKKEYVDNLYSRLKELFAFRYDGKTDNIDSFVATVQSKPMPDPSTAITPVKEEVPVTSTSTTSTTTVTTPDATAPVKTTTNGTTTVTTKTATTGTTAVTTKTTTGTGTSATTKSKVTKPATPKKKGTR